MPRLEIIEAFFEATQAASFRDAAARCALSPAAFSRRIQAFSAYVGRDLFERRDGRMQLTDAGRECEAQLAPVYRSLREATAAVARAPAETTVTISLSHSLSVGWLIPRLEGFRRRHPAIDVQIRTERTAALIRSGDADLGVCASDVDLAGLREAHLLHMLVTPVACPRIAAAFHAGAGRLDDYRLLVMKQHPETWTWWSSETGYPCTSPPPGATFDVLQTMYEAAAAGQGVAVGTCVTVGPHLASGRLVHLGLPSARYPGAYRLAASASRLKSLAVRRLWTWLLDEARTQAADWPALSVEAAMDRRVPA
jgi:DNA-binding transcriptional LysR family regulator